MKPKPFSPLNHFTEPVAIENPLLSWPDLALVRGPWPVARSSQRDFQTTWWCPRAETIARVSEARWSFANGPSTGHTVFTQNLCLTWNARSCERRELAVTAVANPYLQGNFAPVYDE